MKRLIVVLVVILAAASALGQEPVTFEQWQKINAQRLADLEGKLSQLPVKNPALDSYLSTMHDALEPYGTLTAPNCHNVRNRFLGVHATHSRPCENDLCA
jgi:hypothetical protein